MGCEFCESELKTGKRFCSSKCWYDYQRNETEQNKTQKTKKCKSCGNLISDNRIFCSVKCKNKKQLKFEKFIRYCPECDKEINYKTLYSKNVANGKHTRCQSCRTTGNGNPMFGIKRPNHIEKMAKQKRGKTYEEIYGFEAGKILREIRSKANIGKNNPMFGKLRNDVKKLKILSKIMSGRSWCPSFNVEACQFFEKLNKRGLNIQHALNGGEFLIEELSYFLDGYDKETNMVFEWYEDHHFTADGKLKKFDVERKNHIVEFLNCDFIEIKQNRKMNEIILM